MLLDASLKRRGGSSPSVFYRRNRADARPATLGIPLFARQKRSLPRTLPATFPTVTDEEFHARCKAYAMGWKETGPILEEMRREDVRRSKTADFAAFDGMALWEAKRHPPLPTSGLVEQQRLFMKALRR